ncbi:hypothetical protein AC578_2170 [Pseudocercospora eumusae]|nr:hypothetical protein AC578_2170 [Pseudocercospora eumusae]
MYNSKIIFAVLAAAIAVVRSEDLEPNDVPPECRSICQPAIDLENSCDRQFDDDDNDNNNSDQQYRDCVCKAQNANQALSACQNCVVQYPNYFIDADDNDTDDNGMFFDPCCRSCSRPRYSTSESLCREHFDR